MSDPTLPSPDLASADAPTLAAPVAPASGSGATAAGDATLPGRGDRTHPDPGDARPLEQGDALGRYIILGTLGAGGMGVVYAAYDPELDRKLAIKVVLPHAGSRSTEGRQRLLREAQALARLTHPNVVTVHDVGTMGDRIFVAMEFVAGQTFKAWANRGEPDRRETLDRLLAAGRGLAAAHAQGIVHRDFKPDNVMVGDDGRVLVLDFGLARQTSDGPDAEADPPATSGDLDGDLTAAGAVMGTPRYMAPEQWEGKPADARTDQFSFCVTAWEALYGERPFAGSGPAELVLAVTGGHLRAPPRDSSVPGWIRPILERGLARRPADRWPSMDALLGALGRDPTRRRRAGLGLAAVVTAGLAAAGWNAGADERLATACEDPVAEIDELWNERVEEQIAAAFERSSRTAAADVWSRAREAGRAHVEAWRDARHSACLSEASGPREARLAAAAIACLDESRAALGAVAGLLVDADDALVGNAVVAMRRLPPPAECLDPGRLATRPGLPNEPDRRAQAVAVLSDLARAESLESAGRSEQARVDAETALATAHELDWPAGEARAGLAMGNALITLGKFEAAVPALETSHFLAGANRADWVALRAAIRLSFVESDRRRDIEAGWRWIRVAEMFLARLEADGTREHANILQRKALLHVAADRARDGLPLAGRALEITEALDGPSSLAAASTLNTLGLVHDEAGEREAAVQFLTRSLQIYRDILGEHHEEVATAHNNLGVLHWRMGDLEQAEYRIREALRLWKEQRGPTHPLIAAPLTNLSNILSTRGDSEQALALTREALAIDEATHGPWNLDVATSVHNIASSLTRLDRHPEAIDSSRRVLEIYERVEGLESMKAAWGHNWLGDTYTAAGQIDEARAEYGRALEIKLALVGEDHLEPAFTRIQLAEAERKLGSKPRADALYNQALPVTEEQKRPDVAARALFGLAQLHNDPARARRALDLLQARSSPGLQRQIEAWLADR